MADCIRYDVGTWVRQHSDVLLKDTDEDGHVVLSYRKATPAALDVVLSELGEMTNEARAKLDAMKGSGFYLTQQRIRTELENWEVRLGEYQRLVAERPDQLNPEPIYHCVTAPLLLGWRSNEDCSGPDPEQMGQSVPDVAVPMQLLNEILCLEGAQQNASSEVERYWRAVARGFTTIASDAADAAELAIDTVHEGLRFVNESSFAKIALVALVGAAAYIAITR